MDWPPPMNFHFFHNLVEPQVLKMPICHLWQLRFQFPYGWLRFGDFNTSSMPFFLFEITHTHVSLNIHKRLSKDMLFNVVPFLIDHQKLIQNFVLSDIWINYSNTFQQWVVSISLLPPSNRRSKYLYATIGSYDFNFPVNGCFGDFDTSGMLFFLTHDSWNISIYPQKCFST